MRFGCLQTYKSWVTKDVHEHQDTAEKFAQDARLQVSFLARSLDDSLCSSLDFLFCKHMNWYAQVDVDMASIAERMEIRSAVRIPCEIPA